MAFRIKDQKGFTLETDSPEEAASLYQLLSGDAKPAPRKRKASSNPALHLRNGSPGLPPAVQLGQLKTLAGNARRVLDALMKSGVAVTTDELAEKVGVDGAKLPPLIRAVRMALVRAGFANPLIREGYRVGTSPKSRYQLAEEVRNELN